MSLTETAYEKVPQAMKRALHLTASPVWNHDEKRLRAPLRALLPLVVTFAALGAIQAFVRPRFDQQLFVFFVESASLFVVLLMAILGSAKLLDRRPVDEYGFSFDRGWARSFAVGGVIATVANAGTFLVAVGTGWATVSGFLEGSGPLPFMLAMAAAFFFTAVAAAWEEFVFRATMLKNLAEGSNGYLPGWIAVVVAVLLSTAVFAFLHSGKVDDFAIGYSYYAVAGLVLAVAYVLSGDLALPIGFHVFYNYTMAAFFGLGVSQTGPELVALEFAGSNFWIGEEGVIRIVFAIVGGVLLVAYIQYRDGELRIDERVTRWTPRWRRKE